MTFDVKSLINNLLKLILLIAFFIAGYWTKLVIDQHQININREQIEALQIETLKQRHEIDSLLNKASKIDLILEKLNNLEAKHYE